MNNIKEFWRKHKTKIIIGAGAVVVIGATIYICGKKRGRSDFMSHEQLTRASKKNILLLKIMIEDIKTDAAKMSILKNISKHKKILEENRITEKTLTEAVNAVTEELRLGIELDTLYQEIIDSVEQKG